MWRHVYDSPAANIAVTVAPKFPRFISSMALAFILAAIESHAPAADAAEPAPAGNSTPPAAHVRVNEYTYSQQNEAALAIDSQSNITVAWSSRRQQDGRSGIYMKRFAADGAILLPETPVNLFTAAHATSAAIACNKSSGDVWIAWKSHGSDGNAGSIIARRFTSHHNRLAGSSEMLVNQITQGDQDRPLISISEDGVVAIAWIGPDDRGRPTARLRLFNHDAQPITDELRVSCDDAAGARSLAMAWGSDGALTIVAAAVDERGMPAGLHLHRYDSSGKLISTRSRFVCPLAALEQFSAALTLPTLSQAGLSATCSRIAATQIEPAIVATEEGYVIAWLEPAAVGSADWRPIVQRFDPTGKPLSFPFAADPDLRGMQNAIALASDSSDSSMIAMAWNHTRGTDVDATTRVCMRRISIESVSNSDECESANSFLISPPVSATSHGGSQALRAVADTSRVGFTSAGDLVCAWTGDGGLGDSTGVYLSIFPSKATRDDIERLMQFASKASSDRREEISADGDDERAASNEVEAVDIAAPHEPPTFDPHHIVDDSMREIIEGTNEFGFTAIAATGWTPPDPHMGVGPDHVVVMTNGAIAYFSKTGQLQFQMSINGPGGFWGPAGAVANLVFDPEVFYDELSGRFFAVAGEGNAPGGRSFALLAVSDDSNPNGTWHKYRFETTQWSGAIYDSINVGVDDSVVYISGDATGPGFVHPVLTMDKASILAGAPPAVFRVTLMPTSVESAGLPPVSFDDPPAQYFIEHTESATNTTVRLIAMLDPLGTPSFVSTNLTVPAYGRPELVPQAGTTVKFQTFDARFWSVAYRNGFLWATHHINSDRCLARWYQIAMNGWPMSGQQPSLVQWGNIDPGPEIRTFFSAITVDDQGNASMVFARSSPNEFPSMATAHRAASDPPGTFQPSEIRKTSNGPWTANDRWGDYAAVAIDPVDGFTVWAHHEYVLNGNWLTWVQRFTPGPPPPANDLCANAPLIGAGTHAFTTLGASTDGPDEPGLCDFNGSSQINNDVWFRYLAACTGTATIEVCGADFNSKIAVYSSACPAAPGQVIACNDDFCGDDAQVTFATVASTLYRVRIGSPAGGSQWGSGTLTISCESKPPACVADVAPAGGDGVVDVLDLLAIINAWGACPTPPASCAADIAPPGGNGVVDVSDLLTVINEFGPCR